MNGPVTGNPIYTEEFEEVLKAETELVWRRRLRTQNGMAAEAAGQKTNPPDDLLGVALSGGGIRSASFCLGALQALDRFELIKRMDYLSTVSGGGYIGGGMVSWICKSRGEFPYTDRGDFKDTEAVSHIRDHSRYLAPKGPGDLLLSAAVILRGLMTNLVIVLSVLLPLATLILAANPTIAHLKHSFVYDLGALRLGQLYGDPLASHMAWKSSLDRFPEDPLLLTRLGIPALAVFLIAWALYRSCVELSRFGRAPQSVSEPRSRWTRIGAGLIVAFAVLAVAELQGPILVWVATALSAPSRETGAGLGSLSALGAAAIAAIAFFREKLAGIIEQALNHPTWGARFQALLARIALVFAALLVPLLLYSLFLAIVLSGVLDTSDPCRQAKYPFAPDILAENPARIAVWTIGALAVGIVIWLFAILTSKDGRATLRSLIRVLGNVAARGWPLLLLISSGLFVYALVTTTRLSGEGLGMLAAYAAASLLCGFIALNFTENANALHRLYRDRLNVAFRLGSGRKLTYSRPLHRLGLAAPYHLVNCALNLRQSAPPGTDDPAVGARRGPDPAKRGRNAESFIFSRLFIGSDATGYISSKTMADVEPQVDFATAIAISGAAVSSSMGRASVGLLRPTLALLNLRLGFWLRNPKYVNDPTRVQGNWRDFVRPYLFEEAAGRLRADSDRVYVTDGGHFDNIGLYQLLKRRCKIIIVVDAEADPAMNFGALIDVERFARIDMGARIKLDWEVIRDAALARRQAGLPYTATREAGVHEKHFAFGTITYENGTQGLLLYIKANITGDEPDYVLDYQRRYPNFPHEATSNQFFSEEQMEAYRALGFHSVKVALDEPDLDGRESTVSTVVSRAAFKKLIGIEGMTVG